LLHSGLWFATLVYSQQVPSAVTTDPPPDPHHPATMAWPDILSHGAKMYAVIYVASGAGPHPTVLMLHGFPGNEKNLDLAYSMRRAGWNVLAPFYRGAWGSGGTFSFTHALEDAQSCIQFLIDPENDKKFHVDPAHIVLLGHSMGGFVAAYATAQEPKVFAVALISAANLGPASARQRSTDAAEFQARWRDNASRLVGKSAEQLWQEINQNPDFLELFEARPAIEAEAGADPGSRRSQHLRQPGVSRFVTPGRRCTGYRDTHAHRSSVFRSSYRDASRGGELA